MPGSKSFVLYTSLSFIFDDIYRAHYSDGVLSSPKAGVSVDPKPCAGNDGTTITVSSLLLLVHHAAKIFRLKISFTIYPFVFKL